MERRRKGRIVDMYPREQECTGSRQCWYRSEAVQEDRKSVV